MGYVILLGRKVHDTSMDKWDPVKLFYSGDERAETRSAWEALVESELLPIFRIMARPLASAPPRSRLDSDSDDFVFPPNFSPHVNPDTDMTAYVAYVNDAITPEFPDFGEDEDEDAVLADEDDVAPPYGLRGPFAAEMPYDTDVPVFEELENWAITGAAIDDGPAAAAAAATAAGDAATADEADEADEADDMDDSDGEEEAEVAAAAAGGAADEAEDGPGEAAGAGADDGPRTPSKGPRGPQALSVDVVLSPRGAQAVQGMPTDPFVVSSSPVTTPGAMVGRRERKV